MSQTQYLRKSFYFEAELLRLPADLSLRERKRSVLSAGRRVARTSEAVSTSKNYLHKFYHRVMAHMKTRVCPAVGLLCETHVTRVKEIQEILVTGRV